MIVGDTGSQNAANSLPIMLHIGHLYGLGV